MKKRRRKKRKKRERERKREAVGRVRGLGHSPRPGTSTGPPGGYMIMLVTVKL